MRTPDELRALVEAYLGELALTPSSAGWRNRSATRWTAAASGCGRCSAWRRRGGGGEPEAALPAAAALELVHTFSLVHDDLPALDDDEERRGRPSAWAAYGEAVAILAGDALLAEAFGSRSPTPSPAVARELVQATLGMIDGQYLDITAAATTWPRCTG